MRLDYKVILITLIIFSAIIGILILGTDATQDSKQVEIHQCGPGGTCTGCNADISKPSTNPPFSPDAAR
ncbi:hypothetical protein F4X73_00430 [Candidatus Poribacteria bacterium]|nr:hypothetical protein [Candidatus Poribacteria bacterium]MYF54590.1 hypothetical protein [Candidatus Poribacteria bacterium]